MFGPDSGWQPIESKPTGPLAATTTRPRSVRAPASPHESVDHGRSKPRSPYFGILGLLLPCTGVGAVYLYDHWHRVPTISSGGWGLGEIFIASVVVASGFFFGAIATLIAIFTREGWEPVQVLGGVINFGALFLLLIRFVL